MSVAKKLWNEALLLLMAKAPLHASVLSQMKLKTVRGVKWPAATDGAKTVYLNEDRFDGTDDPFIPDGEPHDRRLLMMAALAAHEAEHVLRRVITRSRRMQDMHIAVKRFPDAGQRKQVMQHLFNIAQDFIINHSVRNGVGLPLPGGAAGWDDILEALEHGRNKRFDHLYDPTVGGKNEEWMVRRMLEKLRDPSDAEALDDELGLDGHDELEEAPVEEAQQTVQRAAQMARVMKQRGYVPSDMEHLLEEGVEEVRLPWRRLLARHVQAALAGRHDWTTARPNRYMQTIGSKVLGFGEEHTGVRRVGFVVDTSASMSEDELKMALGALKNLLRAAPPEEVVLMHCDAEVQHEQTLRFGEFDEGKLRRMHGGGGTAFAPALERLDKAGVDLIVYVTDGYGDDPKPPKAPVIWLLTGEHCSASFGRRVCMRH